MRRRTSDAVVTENANKRQANLVEGLIVCRTPFYMKHSIVKLTIEWKPNETWKIQII